MDGRVEVVEKRSKFPRTERRVARIREVLQCRQPDLTVVLEDVHDPHNASAVLRACDAVGVQTVHLVYVHEEPPRRSFSRNVSGSAAKWLQIVKHRSVVDCFAVLRAEGFSILATSLAEESVDLYAFDLTRPVALVFGNEHRGVSPEAVAAADGVVKLPMVGMVQSLNISVACAIALYEAMRQRRAAGAYERTKLNGEELARLEAQWLRK